MLSHHEIREEMIRQLDAEIIRPKEVADALGIPSSRVAEMRNRTRRVQHGEMESLARLLGMAEAGPTATSPATLDDLAEQHGLALVEEVDLALGMGATYLDGGAPEVLGIVPFKLDWLRDLHEGPIERLKVVRGRGDSMQPTIQDGDVVLVDTAHRRIDDQDRIWALAYGELGVIRRVRVTPRGTWMLMPDNAVVRPDEVTDGEAAVIGRVIWIGRRI
jgi:phage repressor protein C with HTH and peptisase S24 domain